MNSPLLLAACLACGTALAQAQTPAYPTTPDTATPTPLTGRDARTLSDALVDPDQKAGSASMPGRTGMGGAPTRVDPLVPTSAGRTGSAPGTSAPSQLPVPGPG